MLVSLPAIDFIPRNGFAYSRLRWPEQGTSSEQQSAKHDKKVFQQCSQLQLYRIINDAISRLPRV
jgi:hypothetical protein